MVAMLGEQRCHERSVTDVAASANMPRIARGRREVAQIAGVGQRIEIDDRLAFLREPIENEIGADEAGAAGDENHGRREC